MEERDEKDDRRAMAERFIAHVMEPEWARARKAASAQMRGLGALLSITPNDHYDLSWLDDPEAVPPSPSPMWRTEWREVGDGSD